MSPDPAPLSDTDAYAALLWQVEMGITDAIENAPIDRYATTAEAMARMTGAAPPPPTAAGGHPPATEPEHPPEAQVPSTLALAAAAQDLDSLRATMAAFDGCALKKGARNFVFADGLPGAHVMIVGEAPGRDEDMEGRPFVGVSGQLLDRMFAAIGLSRTAETPETALYITNTMPWRPPQNRAPTTEELAMMVPFLHRHVQLAAPRVIVAMGNPANQAMSQASLGITRLRGQWQDWNGIPLLPMFHPAALLRDPAKKRDAWADLLALKARLA